MALRDGGNPRPSTDLVIGFKADDDAIRDKIIAHLKEKYPDYTYNVVIDHDYEDDQPT